MFYLDSSVAVSAVSAEATTDAVLHWLATHQDVLTSDWMMTEAAAALSQKRRMDVLSEQEHAEALAALHRQIGGAFPPVPVSRQDFRLAARLAEGADTALRAGDALHLAVASAADATLVTLDKSQARAGELLRLKTLLLQSRP
jgi:predicted nucleic acid-binding protein